MDEKNSQLNIESTPETHAADLASVNVEKPLNAKQQERYNEAKANFANRDVAAPKRNRWWSVAFFVVVMALTFVLMYQLSKNIASGDKTFGEIFSNINLNYALAALAVFAAMVLLDSLKYFIIVHAITGKFRYGTALKTGLLGKYYDNITPFSSGGQPFQVHYLYKKGLTGGESTAIISIKFCFNMMMWLAICFCLMVFNRGALAQYVTDDAQRRLFAILGWVGFGINLSVPLLIIAFAIFPRIMETLARWFLLIGVKLKIIKRRSSVILKAKRISKDFRSAFILMAHKPLHAILLTLCCICEPFLSMTLPFFVVVALGGGTVVPSWELLFALMTLHVYVSMSVTVVPTPGNSGAMESAFMLVLTSVAEGVLFWSVLTWRFLSYYTFIIVGMCVFIADFIRKNKTRKTL